MPLSGTDRISLGGFADDLTYQEVHAFVWGFGLTAAAIATQSSLLTGAAAGLVLFAYTGKWAKAKAMGADVAASVKTQIRREPHYYLGGAVAGAAVGWAANALGIVPNVPL